MPEVIFPGPEGRLEGRYHPQKAKDAPIAIILHPHPQFGGTMNNRVVYNLHYAFQTRWALPCCASTSAAWADPRANTTRASASFPTRLRRSTTFSRSTPNAKHCWVAGFSFGAWIGMQLLMRRPEITGFISVSPPANMYDFSFLAPCPASGLIINGTNDRFAKPQDTRILVDKLHEQKGITITHEEMEAPGISSRTRTWTR